MIPGIYSVPGTYLYTGTIYWVYNVYTVGSLVPSRIRRVDRVDWVEIRKRGDDPALSIKHWCRSNLIDLFSLPLKRMPFWKKLLKPSMGCKEKRHQLHTQSHLQLQNAFPTASKFLVALVFLVCSSGVLSRLAVENSFGSIRGIFGFSPESIATVTNGDHRRQRFWPRIAAPRDRRNDTASSSDHVSSSSNGVFELYARKMTIYFPREMQRNISRFLAASEEKE